METEGVTMKITLTISGMDCNDFTEELKERFRNEVIGIPLCVLLTYFIFSLLSDFKRVSNFVCSGLLLS